MEGRMEKLKDWSMHEQMGCLEVWMCVFCVHFTHY